MKNFIFLYYGLYSKRDRIRWGANLLKKNFLFTVLDCTPWLNRDFWNIYSKNVFKSDEYKIISSKEDFLNFILQINNAIVIENLPINKKSYWMKKILKDRNCIFIAHKFNRIPVVKTKYNYFLKKYLKYIFKLKKIASLLYRGLENKYYSTKVFNYDISILGGLASLKEVKNEKKLNSHSMDYDIYLQIKNNSPSKDANSYAVFLDQDMITHPDLKLLGVEPEVSEFEYYDVLTKFLKKFQEQTKLKIIFATHPKSLNKKLHNLLKNIDVASGDTAELVKNSSAVLLHDSTAVSFAILFNKPTIFLTSNELKKTIFGPRIENCAKILNSKVINMNNYFIEELNSQNLFNIDKRKYKNYLDQFIKMPNSADIPIWENLINYIKNEKISKNIN